MVRGRRAKNPFLVTRFSIYFPLGHSGADFIIILGSLNYLTQ